MADCRASTRTTHETKYPREISCAKVRPCRASDEPAAPPVRTCTSRSAVRTSRATRSSIYHPGRVTNGNEGNQGAVIQSGEGARVRAVDGEESGRTLAPSPRVAVAVAMQARAL